MLGLESKLFQNLFSSAEGALPILPALTQGRTLVPTAGGAVSVRITGIASLGKTLTTKSAKLEALL